jgi:hypothetical protein
MRGFSGQPLGVAAVLLLGASGCALKPADTATASYPSAGLYTPGSTLGASDPTDVPTPGMGLGNRCVALVAGADAGAPTKGTLRIQYSTQTKQGRYAPRNCTAAWLETADGQYVATLEIGAGLRRPGLVYWQDHACTEKPGPDVVTSATLPDHEKPHKAMWSGVDFGGKPVPDATYKLFIEVTESDKEPGEFAVFDIVKGPLPFSMDAPVDFEGSLKQVTLSWEVAAEGSPGGAARGN